MSTPTDAASYTTSEDATGGKAENLTPRPILFHDLEWKRIEAFTDERGMAAEFVRFARSPRSRRFGS